MRQSLRSMFFYTLNPKRRRAAALQSLFVLALTASAGWANDWPQWLGPDREGVWRETGLVEKFPKGGPKVVWRHAAGTGYSGPAVADGLVYVTDRVRATDKNGKPVRPTRAGVPGTERTLCLQADSGEVVWKDEYDCPYTVSYPSGPRTTPLVRDGRVYTLGAMGHLRCLDAKTGKLFWSKQLMRDYGLDSPPIWGFAAHPLLDGDLLYCLVGGEGSAVVALHKDNGQEAWKALNTEEVGYSPPMIYKAGGKRQLMIWLSESINSLDPATGKVYWSLPYPTSGRPKRPAVNIATVRRSGDLLFLSSYYHGPMMLKLAADKPAATLLWATKKMNGDPQDGEVSQSAISLYTLMSTPVIENGHVYGVSANGELTCLRVEDGKQLWRTYAAITGKETDCGTAFLVPLRPAGGEDTKRFVLFNDQGDLILASLTPKGYHEIDRAHILDPSQEARKRMVVWSHPAYARRCVFARNDKEIVCVSMAE